jgi:transcriptional regulator with XRE-family HTH domain
MSSHTWTHGAYIRAHRVALGLSQAALARAARVTVAMISRLESGQRRGRPPLLRDLADALQVPQAELLEHAGYGAEAAYWRAQDVEVRSPDPLTELQRTVEALRLHPTLQRAVLPLVAELVRDHEQEGRERFGRAVARYPGRTAADDARFAALRALLFEPDEALPIVGSAPPSLRAGETD